MVVIMEPEKRIEVSLKNLPKFCCDIISKRNRRMANLPMRPEEYLEEKRIDLIRVADKIANKETRDAKKITINESFKKAKEYVWQEFDGKEFDVVDRDLI